MGYQPSGSDNAKTQKKTKVSSEVIVLSDEESPTSPMESPKDGSLINAHRKNGTPNSAQQSDGSDVNKLREMLQQEEKRLRMLKQLRGRQHSPTAGAADAGASQSAKEISTAQTDDERPKTSTRQGKHNIVVVPGGQKVASAGSGGASTAVGISSRLQQLVDSIAADQALNSQQLGSKTRPLRPSLQAGQQPKTQPQMPSLTTVMSVTASTTPKASLNLPTQNFLQLVSNAAPPLRPKVVTSKRGASSQEVITISDSPSPVSKPPPPLLPTPATTTTSVTRVRGVISNGSIQVSTISSSKAMAKPANASGQVDDVVVRQAVENSRRYKDYLMKQSHVRRSFQKQMEKKIAMCPYPKTFRQVWPVVPVHDPSFVRNFGLEAIFLHLDPDLKISHEKMNSSSRVKPICNQCGCDFASAWQIRKSNSKQLLLCEACDFTNLKILQRSKLANQMKELVDSIKKEEDKFSAECEEARKQVLALEKQTVLSAQGQRPPPLLLQPRVVPSSKVKTSGMNPSSLNSSMVTNNVIMTSSRMPTVTQPYSQPGSFKTTMYEASNQGIVAVNRSDPPRAVIPSILPMTSQHSTSKYPSAGLKTQSGVETENPRKRKEPPDLSREQSPPSKALKPGSVLDQTLHKLTQQLIKRKLDEQRQEMQQAESGKGDGAAKESAESRKSRRKGTPRHKRHLSSSSVTSE